MRDWNQLLGVMTASPSGGLWSSFHSSLTQVARGPGTPQRQQVVSREVSREVTEVDEATVGRGALVDMKTQFTELDLLVE